MIDNREQYKNNIPPVSVSENEDVYKDEEKYWFEDEEDEEDFLNGVLLWLLKRQTEK